nr:hypothetical protein [Tanacetum cinerariifolium]
MLESSIVRDHDMGESSMVPDHDMGESSIVRDDLVDNQIVVLPEHLQNHAYSNGTPYWVPDVPEDEKPKEDPTRAHRLKAALVGGYDKVRGTSTDYCNFKRCVNSFIGDRDAQMLFDKMCKRKVHVPELCFEYYTLPSKELVRLFWADETMKCNYVAFGDVVSFNATFHTNKYGYKFVPFIGINHNQRCVTFGAVSLSDETTESFSWMLEAFLKTHKKQPPFAVTNQDEKLPGKVLGDLAANNNFRKDFHKLVWNLYIGPDVFEQRWNDMISLYNLHDKKWLFDMYAIRQRWVPGNTLVQFMLCFESAMEKQRYTQRVLDNAPNGSTPTILTELPFEKHACDVYTPSVFKEAESYNALYYNCIQGAHSPFII